MRLLPKLLLLMVGVAAIPLGLAGYNSIRISQDVTRTQVRDAQLRLAENLAEPVHGFLQETAFALSNAGGAFDFAALPPGQRHGALKLLFFQLPQGDLIALFGEDGQASVPPVAVAPGELPPEALRNRASRDAAQVERFLEALPLKLAKEDGWDASPPYGSAEERGPHVAMAVPLDTGEILAAEVSLDRVRRSLEAFRLGERGVAFVLDQAGTIAVHRDREKTGKSLAAQPFIADRLAQRVSAAGEFTDDEGVHWIAAYAPVGPGVDWGIVVAQPSADAFIAASSLRNQTILWLVAALLFAVVLAAFYANEVRRPIGDVAEGANRLAAGALEHRIKVTTRDEVGELAASFNDMAGKLQASIREIERQNEEIRAWNATLAQKVDERTRALREAQARLVQSKKLAALGELGAGVAHELNNPLAAVKGFAQLLMAHHKPEDKQYKQLKTIEEQAGRCSEIVTRLLRFSQEAARTAREKVDLHRVLADALTLVEGRIREGDVKIHQELAAALPPILGSAGELREVFWHVLSNARNAMPDGGTLTIRTWSETGKQGEEVKISFQDTGKGIDPEILERIFEPFFTTKTQWRGTGLGLAVVHRIVTDHGGTVDAASEPGKGATFTLSFPVATAEFAEGPRADDEVPGPRPKTQLV